MRTWNASRLRPGRTGRRADVSLKPTFARNQVRADQLKIAEVKEVYMDKDRVEGAVEKVKGTLKNLAGKLTGDSKLQAEGTTQKAAGTVQNTVGGVKDSLRGKP